MEKIKTRSVRRFAITRYGGVALLMLASALVGVGAGHAFGAAQPAIAAPAMAEVIAQAEPGQSTATGILDDARMTGTYQPGMQGLQLPSAAASNAASQNDLRWEINAMRQARRAVQPTTDISDDAANLSVSAQIKFPTANPDFTHDARPPQMIGTYQPGMQGLQQSGTAISVNAANLSDSAQIEFPTANPDFTHDVRGQYR